MLKDTLKEPGSPVSIWWLALGYFAFYIPYSTLVKALSSGLLEQNGLISGARGAISGFELLPSVLIGTVITMPIIMLSLGWYRYMGRRDVLGFKLPCPSSWAFFSGISFAAIIATTTLAYSFTGVSIVLALMLMRGGVLILSPIIDNIFSRPVHWFSWAGFGLSLLAVSIAVAEQEEYLLPGALFLNLFVYLAAYMLRLRFMTSCAKDVDETVNRRFFVEENTVAMVSLLAIPGIVAAFGIGEPGLALRAGFTAFLASDRAWVGVAIGVLYGCLATFGSLIYLNRRENTFTIPVNRCASLLSGLVASTFMIIWLDAEALHVSQLIGSAIIVVALLLMSVFDTRHMAGKDNHDPMQRVFLFICDDNCICSPMAAAICNDELRKQLGPTVAVTPESEIYARSAGLSFRAERAMPDRVREALFELAVPVPESEVNLVNSYGMHRAEKVLCMTDGQKEELIARFPWAAEKVIRLDQQSDIPQPEAGRQEQFRDLAVALRASICPWVITLRSSFESPKG